MFGGLAGGGLGVCFWWFCLSGGRRYGDSASSSFTTSCFHLVRAGRIRLYLECLSSGMTGYVFSSLRGALEPTLPGPYWVRTKYFLVCSEVQPLVVSDTLGMQFAFISDGVFRAPVRFNPVINPMFQFIQCHSVIGIRCFRSWHYDNGSRAGFTLIDAFDAGPSARRLHFSVLSPLEWVE